MSQRRSFHCPTCKADVVATLLEDNSLRCDWRVVGWKAVLVGKDRKGADEYDHIPDSIPGCGGIKTVCVHGLRECGALPPCQNFYPAKERPVAMASLAETMRADAAKAAAARADVGRLRELAHSHVPKGAPDTGKRVQMPFLGEAEPERWTPPKSRKRKAAT